MLSIMNTTSTWFIDDVYLGGCHVVRIGRQRVIVAKCLSRMLVRRACRVNHWCIQPEDFALHYHVS